MSDSIGWQNTTFEIKPHCEARRSFTKPSATFEGVFINESPSLRDTQLDIRTGIEIPGTDEEIPF